MRGVLKQQLVRLWFHMGYKCCCPLDILGRGRGGGGTSGPVLQVWRKLPVGWQAFQANSPPGLLGGSWVVSRAISTWKKVITFATILITLLASSLNPKP